MKNKADKLADIVTKQYGSQTVDPEWYRILHVVEEEFDDSFEWNTSDILDVLRNAVSKTSIKDAKLNPRKLTEIEKQLARAEFAENALAGMIRAARLKGVDLSDIDYSNAGIAQAELTAWWENRERMDEEAAQARMLKELKAEAKRVAAEDLKNRKEAALAKLTPDERKILGIK